MFSFSLYSFSWKEWSGIVTSMNSLDKTDLNWASASHFTLDAHPWGTVCIKDLTSGGGPAAARRAQPIQRASFCTDGQTEGQPLTQGTGTARWHPRASEPSPLTPDPDLQTWTVSFTFWKTVLCITDLQCKLYSLEPCPDQRWRQGSGCRNVWI